MASSSRQVAVASYGPSSRGIDDDDDDDRLDKVHASPEYREIDGHGTRTRQVDGQEEGDDKYERQAGTWLVFTILFLQGGTMLLPWNTLVTASEYFRDIFKSGPFQTSFDSWLITLFTLANLLCLSHAVYSQRKARLNRRILISLLTTDSALILLAFSAARRWADVVHSHHGQGFFLLLMLIAVVTSGAGSYLQNSLIALASMLGGGYVGAIMSGQGAIGVIIAVVQLTSQVRTDADEADKQGLRQGTFLFFLIAAIFAGFAILSHLLLARLEIYKAALRRHQALQISHRSLGESKESSGQLKNIGTKLLPLAFAIFWIFTVSISIFPTVTSRVQSVNSEPKTLFIPIHFVVFNVFDFLGRLAPSLQFRSWTRRNAQGECIPWRESLSAKTLVLASLARTVFVPLVASCNVVSSHDTARQPLFASDVVYFLILAAMAFTNGSLASLIMIKGPSIAWMSDPDYTPAPSAADEGSDLDPEPHASHSPSAKGRSWLSDWEPRITPKEQDLAGTILAFALTIGLLAGSLASFGLAAWLD